MEKGMRMLAPMIVALMIAGCGERLADPTARDVTLMQKQVRAVICADGTVADRGNKLALLVESPVFNQRENAGDPVRDVVSEIERNGC